MFHCEQCGTSFNADVAWTGRSCPRCRLRGGTDVPLHFRLFEPAALQVASLEPKRAAEVDVEADALEIEAG